MASATAEEEAQQAPVDAVVAVAAPVRVVPQEVVSLDDIRAMAAQFEQQRQLIALFEAKQYEAMLAMFERLQAQQDEDEIELLLLSL